MHTKYPVLALLLSITNISTINTSFSGIRSVGPRWTTSVVIGDAPTAQGMDLGPFGHIIPPKSIANISAQHISEHSRPADSFVAIIIYHLVALAAATVVI
jgi:hypothetical protein